MGGKPSKGTPADKRLKANRRRGGSKNAGKGAGAGGVIMTGKPRPTKRG